MELKEINRLTIDDLDFGRYGLVKKEYLEYLNYTNP